MQIEEVNTSVKANISLAFKLEMNIPRISYLHNADENELKDVEENWQNWRKNKSIAIEKRKGMRITYTVYSDGKNILYTANSIHRKNILSGGMGVILVDNLVTVFHNDKNPIMDKFLKILDIFKGYAGLIQIDTLIDSDNKVWYEDIKFGSSLEWYLAFSKIHMDEVELFNVAEAEFKRGFGVGCLVYSFPNDPIGLEEDFIFDTDNGSYAVNKDERVSDSWKGLYKNIKDLKIKDLCFRQDGGQKEQKSWFTLRKKGFI